MRFTQNLEKPDDKPPKDPLLEALEKTLEESRRLRGEIGEEGPPPSAARYDRASP